MSTAKKTADKHEKPAPKEATNVFELEPHGHKVHVKLNGELIHRAGGISAAQETVRKRSKGMPNCVVRMMGGLTEQHALGAVPIVPPPPDFTVEQKIHFLRTNVRMVAKGVSNSLLVIGEGGLGKTWNTMEVLQECGLKDLRKTMVEAEIGQKILMKNHYLFVKGTGSAKGLYRLLFENNNGLLILDDADDLLFDKTGQNLLKTALDTLNERWLTWQAEEPPGGSDLPRSFEYTGRIIFLSNQPPEKVNQALKTRALRADMSFSRDQIIEYMETYIIPNDVFMPDISAKHKQDALNLIKDIRDMIPLKSFSARALIHACNYRASGEKDWKDLATHSLTSK